MLKGIFLIFHTTYSVNVLIIFHILCKGLAVLIKEVSKRDGRTIPFNEEKITRAIFLAASQVAENEGKKADYHLSELLTKGV